MRVYGFTVYGSTGGNDVIPGAASDSPWPRQVVSRGSKSRDLPTSTIDIPWERPRLFLPRPDLVERVTVVETAIHHHIPNAVRVAKILERVAVQHYQIGELPRLQRAQVLRQSNALSTHDRRRPQGVM